MVLAPEHPLVDELVGAAWPDGVDPRWTGGAATPMEAVDAYRRAAGPQERGRPADRRSRQDRRVPRRVRHQPGQRRADPGVRRRLRAHGLRHRRHHGGARPGPARLGLRRGLRAPDRPHGAAARGLGGRGRSSARGRRSTPAFLDGLGVSEAKTAITDWLERARPRRPAPSPTSCATGCSPGSATGASRSRSCSTSTTCPARCPSTSCPVLLPEVDDYSPRTFADRRQHLRSGAAARAGRGVGGGHARPRRRAEGVPPRAEHDAELGRLVLVRAALPRPHQRERLRRPRGGAVLDGPAVRGRHRRRRPLRRRRRARRAPPALRPLLAQGAVRPRPPQLERAVPAARQPGLHPGARLHRRPRLLRRGQRGRRARRRASSTATCRSPASSGRSARA